MRHWEQNTFLSSTHTVQVIFVLQFPQKESKIQASILDLASQMDSRFEIVIAREELDASQFQGTAMKQV